ncbi:hypothetical protein M407DRAFT_35138 [Tulasnella calospora MUT 4182]|uniref:Uncharacterized protein n=1 Tax=Tulasnella calospora MUT 4182 TaxID=1051891 RepID=A0A0C3PLY7_9AGAM|nr:hypothetical protein M407DRAFT_35138 [Tulasnella calospora MUT 4182]
MAIYLETLKLRLTSDYRRYLRISNRRPVRARPSDLDRSTKPVVLAAASL